jgi:antibiotic biosynthesis monooxygenase (ABM) superfamily enzyme
MLTREQLKDLRGQICLCSLYLSDFKNDMNIDTCKVSDFFDGYADYLEELMQEEHGKGYNYFSLLNRYDTLDNLEGWYNCFEEDPLLINEELEEVA